MPRLEALKAKKGDCLLLHYGTAERPRLLMVDGGPGGVWNQHLKTRLQQLRPGDDEEERPRLSLLMVSHIDDDHINGAIQLTEHLKRQQGVADLLVEVERFWHNSFDDVFGDLGLGVAELGGGGVTESSVERLSLATGLSDEGALVLLSVDQGRILRDNAGVLGWSVNTPFRGLVKGGEAESRVDLPDGLSLTVIGPTQAQIDEFHRAWDRELRKGKSQLETAAYLDDSVYNLASIVVLVEVEGSRILFTGDARGDHVLQGARSAGLLDDEGVCRLDLLKVPHHGSSRTVDADFFGAFPASSYVFSGDGSHGNPTLETFRMLFDGRNDPATFTIYLTYDPAEYRAHKPARDEPPQPYPVRELLELLSAQRDAGREFQIVFPSRSETLVTVDL